MVDKNDWNDIVEESEWLGDLKESHKDIHEEGEEIDIRISVLDEQLADTEE